MALLGGGDGGGGGGGGDGGGIRFTTSLPQRMRCVAMLGRKISCVVVKCDKKKLVSLNPASPFP